MKERFRSTSTTVKALIIGYFVMCVGGAVAGAMDARPGQEILGAIFGFFLMVPIALIILVVIFGPILYVFGWFAIIANDCYRTVTNKPTYFGETGNRGSEYSGYRHGIQQVPTGRPGTDPYVASGQFSQQPGQPKHPRPVQPG